VTYKRMIHLIEFGVCMINNWQIRSNKFYQTPLW